MTAPAREAWWDQGERLSLPRYIRMEPTVRELDLRPGRLQREKKGRVAQVT